MRAYCYTHKDYQRGCTDCQEHSRRHQAARRSGVAAGTWDSGLVEGDELERVREHVRGLLEVPGVTGERINLVAGVSHHSVNMLLNGRRRLSRPVAEALLGVGAAACLALIGPTTPVPLTGTVRRLRALAVDGWSTEEISGLVGFHVDVVRRHRFARKTTMLTFAAHEKYRLLYEKIQSLADPRGSSAITARRAQAAGWLGPERWADEDIDDPDAESLPPPPDSDDWVAVSNLVDGALRDPRPGKAADYPRPVQREIARQAYYRLGWSLTRIGELLGKTKSTVEFLLHGRRDRPSTLRGENV